MRLNDLTNGQIMAMCQATDCEECSFHFNGTHNFNKSFGEGWNCRLLRPRDWNETEASRMVRFGRGQQPPPTYFTKKTRNIYGMNIPEVWERLLEAEHQLMLTLLEDPK